MCPLLPAFLRTHKLFVCDNVTFMGWKRLAHKHTHTTPSMHVHAHIKPVAHAVRQGEPQRFLLCKWHAAIVKQSKTQQARKSSILCNWHACQMTGQQTGDSVGVTWTCRLQRLVTTEAAGFPHWTNSVCRLHLHCRETRNCTRPRWIFNIIYVFNPVYIVCHVCMPWCLFMYAFLLLLRLIGCYVHRKCPCCETIKTQLYSVILHNQIQRKTN